MKKVLIFYGSYGGGHLSAAKSIYDFICNNYENVNLELIDCMKYIDRVINAISTKAYSEIAKKAPWAWGKVYYNAEKGTLSKITHASNRLLAYKLNKLIQRINPDLIISTHPFSSSMCGYLKKKKQIFCKVATIFTDYAIHSQWLFCADYVDYFFVAHQGMKSALIKRDIPIYKIFVTGIPISAKFSNTFNKKEILDNFNLVSNKTTCLFFAGGELGLGKNKTLEIFETLLTEFPLLQIIAVAGKNEKIKKQFNTLVETYHKNDTVRVLGFSQKVPELMHISDFVITKPGGLTTTESLVSTLPILVINPIPGQEEENADFIEKNHLGSWLKKGDSISEILHTFVDSNSSLTEMRANIRAIAKKDSTKDICRILLEI